MTLKLRFALLFNLIVAIILILSSITIYSFFSLHRQKEFKNKLRTEAIISLSNFGNNNQNLKDLGINISNELTEIYLFEKQNLIISEDKKIINATPTKSIFKISTKTFALIKNLKEYFFKESNREFFGIYIVNEKMFVIASAIDKDGLNKLANLRLILVGVFFCFLILTGLITYWFVNSALRPLTNLNNKIKLTTEKNLWQKVELTKGKDEIAQITSNYDALIERLKNAFDLQKNFVQYASHELRTPLTLMYATTQAALNKKLTEEEYKKTLELLQVEQNNLIDLTNSLLLLSQFEKLEFSSILHTFRIDELIYDAISYGKANFPGIIIDFGFENFPEENNLLINGNETLLKSAFINLIKNAFLYSENKKLSILLFAKNKDIQIHFINTGNQLTESVISNMKIPFSSRENIGLVKGIGLGLSIVQKIISIHNGTFSYSKISTNINKFTIALS